MDWDRNLNTWGHKLEPHYRHHDGEDLTLEQLYQQFKERLMVTGGADRFIEHEWHADTHHDEISQIRKDIEQLKYHMANSIPDKPECNHVYGMYNASSVYCYSAPRGKDGNMDIMGRVMSAIFKHCPECGHKL